MTSPSAPRENIVDRLRSAGRLVDALSFLLGREIDPVKTEAIRCLEPAHHEHGDVTPSAIIEPRAGRVACAVSGRSWGLLEVGVLMGHGLTTADVARVLEERFFGSTTRAVPGFVATAGTAEWPYYPKTAVALGWELITEGDGTPALRLPTWQVDGSRARTKVRRKKRDDADKRTARFEGDGDVCGLINVPAVLAARKSGAPVTIVLLAGETDLLAWTHRAQAEGIIAVALSHSTGEGSSIRSFVELFADADVVVIYDNDKTGREQGPRRAAELHGIASSVVSIHVPDPHKDVCDYLRAGGTVRALLALATATKPPCPGSNAAVSSPLPRGRKRKWKPFAVHALPEPVRSFVTQVAMALGCDPAFVALPTLATLAASIGNSHVIRLKSTWPEPSVLWTSVVSESGSLKSPAQDFAVAPLQRRQSEAFQRHKEQEPDIEAARQRHKVELDKWRKSGGAGDPPPAPRAKGAERFIVDDVTVEAVALRLQDAPRGLLLCRDELSGWLKSFDAYRQGRGGDEAQWLRMHGARPLTVDRKTGEHGTIHVPHAAVSITGGVQPGVLQSILGREHFESGLVARFLLAHPPRRTKRWTNAVVDPELIDAYDTLVGRLLELCNCDDDAQSIEPIVVNLSPEALKLWISFYDRHAKRQGEASGDEAAMLAKIEGAAARLALVIYSVRSVGDEAASLGVYVDADSVRAGIEIAEWFADEDERVYEEFRQSPQERQRQELVDWIERRRGRVTVRELTQGPRKFRGETKAARAALDELVREGLGRWEDAPARDQGGRPTEYFVLAPVDPRESDSPEAATATKPPESASKPGVSSPSPDEADRGPHGEDGVSP